MREARRLDRAPAEELLDAASREQDERLCYKGMEWTALDVRQVVLERWGTVSTDTVDLRLRAHLDMRVQNHCMSEDVQDRRSRLRAVCMSVSLYAKE